MDENPIDLQAIIEMAERLKITPTMIVRSYAGCYAPDVPREMVDAICRALGEISVDEAKAALDQFQAEAITPSC